MKTLKLHYAKLANMGDLLNPLIIEKLYGCKVERNSFLTGEMCAIGSCLNQYTYHGNILMRIQQLINRFKNPHTYVWGTGFIDYDDAKGHFFKRDMEFLAVRGELTRKNIEHMTGRKYDIPTGDAGILADLLLDEIPDKKYDIGIIPHICDLADPAVEDIAGNYENACLINVKEDPIEVIRQIAMCRTVISSSLHGLIVADSFNIPNMHVIISDRPKGDGYKFDDYYSAYGIEHTARDLRCSSLPSISEVRDAYKITPQMVSEKKKLMYESFPAKFIDKEAK